MSTVGTRSMIRLVGDELLNKDGATVKFQEIRAKVIGLYFSSSRCDASKVFNQQLIEFYESFKKTPDVFEIVLVSSDQTEAQFVETFQQMPWLAIPYHLRVKQKYLSRKFRAHNSPRLILFDASSGDVLTFNGQEHVTDDPTGKHFPWKPLPLTDILNNGDYVTKDGDCVNYAKFRNKYKGLYYSAHWCPPCKALTPQLVETYAKLQSGGKKLEIIFVSSDRSQESFDQYLQTMPWVAIPFLDETKRRDLALNLHVEGIPTLIILDNNNDVITRDGRFEILDDPEGDRFPWYPRLVDELTEKYSDKMDLRPSVILFTEEEEMDAAFSTLQPVAEQFLELKTDKDQEKDQGTHNALKFFCGGDAEFCESLRSFLELDDQVPLLIILDIPEGKKYILDEDIEITPEVITKFVNQYFNGELEGLPVRSEL